jgi:hypothetical protein
MSDTSDDGYSQSLLQKLWKSMKDVVPSTQVPTTTDIAFEMQGGGKKSDTFMCTFMSCFLQRALLRTFVFNTSMLLTIVFLRSTGLDQKIWTMNSDQEQTYFVKLGKILLIYIVFLVITILLYDYVLTNIAYLIVKMYALSGNIDLNKSDEIVKQTWDYVWNSFQYVKPDETIGDGEMGIFTIVSVAATLGLFVFFIIYVLFVKDFIHKLSYPKYVDNTEDVSEDDNETNRLMNTFIVHQSLFITYVMLFGIGLTVAHHSSKYDLLRITRGSLLYIMLFVYAILFTLTMRYHLLQKNLLTFVCVFSLLLYVVAIYVGLIRIHI